MDVAIPGWANSDVSSFRKSGHFQGPDIKNEAVDAYTAERLQDVLTSIGMDSFKAIDETDRDEARGQPGEVLTDWGDTKAHASFSGDTQQGSSTCIFQGLEVAVTDFSSDSMNCITVMQDGTGAHGVHLDRSHPENSYIETRHFHIAS